jgi:hypothetical protein
MCFLQIGCEGSYIHVLKRFERIARSHSKKQDTVQSWAKVGMQLTFRAEVMPGRETSNRTFTVASVLATGRVELIGLVGQHSEAEFESAR